MLKKCMLTTLVLTGMAALAGVAVFAQDAPAPSPRRASSDDFRQFDIGASFYKTFVNNTSGMGLQQTPSDGLGGMIEGRHLISPLIGYEMAISVNSGGQAYAPIAGNCGYTCQNPPISIDGKQLELSFDYVPSYKFGNLRPFLVAGLGIFISVPDATLLGNNTSIRGAYVYGGGVDYDISRRFGIRAQYRGTFYKAPNISLVYPADGQYTQTAMPMGGVYYRF